MARNQETADARVTLKTFPTPLGTDVLFYIMRDATLPRNQVPAYGTKFDDIQPRKESWPDHVLVFISPADVDNQQRWYFAAPRDKQDEYNWEMSNGEELTRTYVIPRNLYFARGASGSSIDGEFTCPIAGSLDTRFPQFGFADDTLVNAPEELRSLYVIIQRRFIEPVEYELKYSDQFERTILIKKEVIPVSKPPIAPLIKDGVVVEVKPGNIFHDFRITEQIVDIDIDGNIILDGDGNPAQPTYPSQLSLIPGYSDYPFPTRLDAVNIVYAWAWANSDTAPYAYDEAYYFEWKMTQPRNGPYEARILRFLTDKPDELRTTYPLFIAPSPRRETIGISYSWWHSSKKGNSAQAKAHEVEVPSTVHEGILITVNGIDLPTAESGNRTNLNTTELHETPNYSQYITALNDYITVSYKTEKTQLGIYIVQITQIKALGLYSDYSNTSTTMISSNGGTDADGTITVSDGQPALIFINIPIPLSSNNIFIWTKGGVPLTNTRTSSRSISIFSVSPSDAGDYYLEVLGWDGQVVFAGSVTLIVTAVAPTIQLQPLDEAIGEGDAPRPLVISSDSATSCTWYLGMVGDTSMPIGTGWTIQPLIPLATAYYWAQVSNTTGTTNSRQVTITGIPTP